MAEHTPPEMRNRVMHASFTAPGIEFMASDGRETKPVDPDAGNISAFACDQRSRRRRAHLQRARRGRKNLGSIG